jgi:hypothetical protein
MIVTSRPVRSKSTRGSGISIHTFLHHRVRAPGYLRSVSTPPTCTMHPQRTTHIQIGQGLTLLMRSLSLRNAYRLLHRGIETAGSA